MNVRDGPPRESLSSMRLSVIRYIADPTKAPIEYIDFTPTRIMDHWTDPNSAHKRVGYWVGETWLRDKVAPEGEPITDLSRVQSLDYASVSTPIEQKRKSCKSVTWNIAETYEYTVPEWRLLNPCPKERERTGNHIYWRIPILKKCISGISMLDSLRTRR